VEVKRKGISDIQTRIKKVVAVTSLERVKDLNLPLKRKFHFAKKGLGSLGGQQVEHEPAVCPYGKEG